MIKLENLPELNIKVDNRMLDKDSLFIAIKGERFNPLEHLEMVVKSGCKYVLCEKQHEKLTKDYEKSLNFIFVDDIVLAIQDLGHKVAQQFKNRGGKIIAISGSNGKTTTKEMLFHLLDTVHPSEVICTQKNNNNHLGVPFSLFQIKKETKYAIIELGSNHPGEIETLCKISIPDFGVTTNIGATHLEFFGTLENVLKEEATLGHYADVFLMNADDELLKSFSTEKKVIQFGEAGLDYKFEFPNPQEVKVNHNLLANTRITGRHNFINLAVAFVLAKLLDSEKIENYIDAAKSFQPTANRSQWVEWNGVETFLDAYNANPSSMQASVSGFMEKIGDSEQVVLVLGDMNELGKDAAKFHIETGKFLTQYPKSQKVFIGKWADNYAEGLGLDCFCFGSVQEASNDLKNLSQQVKFALIKGSRSLQLETILDI